MAEEPDLKDAKPQGNEAEGGRRHQMKRGATAPWDVMTTRHVSKKRRLRPPAERTVEVSLKAKEAPPGPVRVLLVDDEPDVLRSTQMLLQRLGYECVTLLDPGRVAEVAAKERPAAILQDLLMPGLDLGTTLRRLQENEATAKIPIVFFSASTDLPQVAAQYDVAGYLSKPFEERQLTDILDRAAGRPTVRAEIPMPGPEAGEPDHVRDMRRQSVRQYFHEYWNVLTALRNYAQFLTDRPNMSRAEQEAAREIGRLLIDLERRTDLLRGQLLEFVG